MKVISNTTVVSNFAAVGRLDVLHSLLKEVYLSADVLAEIQDGLAEGCDFYNGIENSIYPFNPDGWLRLTSLEGEAELRLFGQLPAALHRGEGSCIAIAVQRGWRYFRTTPMHAKSRIDMPLPYRARWACSHRRFAPNC